MKLAYVIPRYGTAFPANEIHLKLCQALAELGWDVTVIAFSMEGYGGGVPSVLLQPQARPWGPWARALAKAVTGYPHLFSLASALSGELARQPFDAVHVEGIFPAGAVLWLANRRGVPYAVSLQGTDVIRRPELGLDRLEKPAVRWMASRALQGARMVRANSLLTAELVRNAVPRGKVRVIPRNIAARYFAYTLEQSSELRDRARRLLAEKLSLGPEPTVMAFGRLHPCKGFEQLLEASALLQGQGIAHRLVVAGPDSPEVDRRGSYRARLRALAERLPFTLPPLLLEAVDEEEMPTYYAAAQAVAVPSLLEGFNKVALEAAAMGTPVVISTGAGAHPYFSQHRAGLVVPAGDPERLAEALARLVVDPAAASEMGRRAYAMARLFTPQRVAEQMLDLLNELLQ